MIRPKIRFTAIAALCSGMLIAGTVHAGPSNAQKCMSAKLKILSKYDLCVLKTEATAALLGQTGDTALCDSKFQVQWTKPDGKYAADCPSASSSSLSAEVHDHLADIKALLANASSCDVLTQDCSPGQACYYGDSWTTYCATAGSGTTGVPCTAQQDCAAGYMCVSNGVQMTCRQVCARDGGDPVCPGGQTCTAFSSPPPGPNEPGACF